MLGAVAGVLWARPFRARVRGDSMLPTLSDGDVVVALRGLRPRRGDLAVVIHGGVEMVKRVEVAPGDEAMPGWLLGDDEWLVTGDNREASTDSRSFGPLSGEAIRAKVVWPRARRGN